MTVAEKDTPDPPVLELPAARCQKCGERWTPRTEQPRVCPFCKNPKWWRGSDSPYSTGSSPPTFDVVEVTCNRCGQSWCPTTKQPDTCPACKNPKWWDDGNR